METKIALAKEYVTNTCVAIHGSSDDSTYQLSNVFKPLYASPDATSLNLDCIDLKCPLIYLTFFS